MALDAAEEESIEALKKWWNENGNQLMAVIAIVVVGYGGWTFWSSSQANQAAAASDVYEEILALALPAPEAAPSDADREQIKELAAELKESAGSSKYAHFAALFAAQKAVEVNDLDTAEAELQWIIDNQPDGFLSDEDEGLVLTASMRLGRVILAKGEADRALEIVNNVDPKSFEAGFAELRGDIYTALGRLGDAGDAYRAALQAGASSNTLQMKLDNVTG